MHQIFDYENASEINPILCQKISRYDIEDVVVGGGRKTDMNLHKKGIPELTTLLNWIDDLTPIAAHGFTSADKYDKNNYRLISDQGGGKYNFNIKAFELHHCWGITYNKGEGVERHNHFPYALSFCYYVNLPSGSSPLVLDNEVINLKEGQVIFFLSSSYHSVPPASVNGRCVVVGNIMYKEYDRILVIDK